MLTMPLLLRHYAPAFFTIRRRYDMPPYCHLLTLLRAYCHIISCRRRHHYGHYTYATAVEITPYYAFRCASAPLMKPSASLLAAALRYAEISYATLFMPLRHTMLLAPCHATFILHYTYAAARH